MKKLFLFSALVFGVGLSFARTWTISTSCGTTVTKNISDSATIDQIKDAVSAVNVSECGVKPSTITITV